MAEDISGSGECRTPFQFDLQCFAGETGDGGYPSGDSVPTTDTGAVEASGQDGSTTAAEGVAPAPEETDSTEHSQPDVAVQIDPITGRRVLVVPEQAAVGGDEQEAGGEQQNADPPAPAAYSSDELIAAMTEGTVDESRIPDNLRGNYLAIQRQQQLQQLQAQQAQQQAMMQQKQEPQQQQPQISQEELYKRINSLAHKQAMQEVGITQEDIDGASYSDDDTVKSKVAAYNVAMQANVNKILTQITYEQAQQSQIRAESQAALQQIIPAVAEYQKDPNFPAIDRMLKSHYQTMPYQQACQISAAIQRVERGVPTRADLPVLESYYKATREAFYSKQAGVTRTPQPAQKAKPPVVETPGGKAATQPQNVDWRSMRNMDTRERSEFLRSHLM